MFPSHDPVAYIAEAVKQGNLLGFMGVGDKNWSNFDPDLTELAETFLGRGS